MIDLDTKPFSIIQFKDSLEILRDFIDIKSYYQIKARGLIPGRYYTVDEIETTSSYSSVYLVEYPNEAFNPLMFNNLEKENL